ncbi:MAG TPA: GMC family oxidoreductase [Planctomycetes bacterium]|nr:GMC family oxidoreductase [Planctomycetota bacterium]HIL36081.1 GMC family oxidoreductase [Planctomycetota bacterium]
MSSVGSASKGEREHYDWIIVGSGFGGSVSALRLAQKGYSVLVLEQGRRFRDEDFARSNWNLRRWLWLPWLGCRGILRLTFFRHMTVLSGVGVGGGSLVYANTLPTPSDSFFESSSWSGLADWKSELAPHYETALRMLGAAEVPFSTPADEALAAVAADLGLADQHHPARVGVWFGEPGVTVPDPYLGGEGPPRTGCIRCGACMVGCRHGAKNSLPHNYLHLAEKLGVRVQADTRVTAVKQAKARERVTLETRVRRWGGFFSTRSYSADRVVMAGGVLGTLPLLLSMAGREQGLPQVSDQLGRSVRTNCESLTGVQTFRRGVDHSKGVAIGSILHLDKGTHLETVRYPSGSGFFRLGMAPHGRGRNLFARCRDIVGKVARHPVRWLRAYTVLDWARSTVILLYMKSHPETLTLKLGRLGSLRSRSNDGPGPTADMPQADDLGERMAEKLDGDVGTLVTQTLLGKPTTAHILGGCAMGASSAEGVIDSSHRLFGHPEILVIDGSAVSANPGVNPSLTITALAERAMGLVPEANA